MPETDRPKIYLITPPELDLSVFPDILCAVLDACPVACLRMALSSQDEDHILRVGDTLREITHSRDIPLVVQTHVAMVARLGLDGVHLLDGPRSVRQTRKDLGDDAIIGAFCATSRHDGMGAAEAGADYVCFGPVGKTALGDGSTVDMDVFNWWSEVIEIPVVAEGGIDHETMATLSDITDFVALGPEIWRAVDPAKQLIQLVGYLEPNP